MTHWPLTLRVAVGLVVLAAIASVARQAIAGHDAAVIACQGLAMTTLAWGPLLVYRRVQAKKRAAADASPAHL